MAVDIQKKKISLGLKGHPPVLEGEMYNNVKTDEVTWCIQDKKVSTNTHTKIYTTEREVVFVSTI